MGNSPSSPSPPPPGEMKCPWNCLVGANYDNQSPLFSRYSYDCVAPKPYIKQPKVSDGNWMSPDDDAIYYRGPNNEFNVSVKPLFRRLIRETPNTNEFLTSDPDSVAAFEVKYKVDWENPDINGYKVLDLLQFVSRFRNSNAKIGNENINDYNKAEADKFAKDFCNFSGLTGGNEEISVLCTPNENLPVNFPTILNRQDAPCKNYTCREGWNKYCGKTTNYNNQDCTNFYNYAVGDTGLVDIELEGTLNKTCADIYNNGGSPDMSVCACFLKDTDVYTELLKNARVPDYISFGKPKCWYPACVASYYQNSGDRCTDLTYSQCIQNSYTEIGAGGNIEDTRNEVNQVINSCGPTNPGEEETEKDMPEPQAVPPEEVPEEKEEEEVSEEEKTLIQKLAQYKIYIIMIIVFIFVAIVVSKIKK